MKSHKKISDDDSTTRKRKGIINERRIPIFNVQPTVIAPSPSFDAFLPPEMAGKAEAIGVKKATMGPRNTFALAVLAGAFIGLGAIFATTVTTGAAGHMSYGMTKLAGGLVFCLGLILVVVAGAELSPATT